jgi:phosphate acetyltransferase
VVHLSEVQPIRHARFSALLARIARIARTRPLTTAIVHPCDALSLQAAVDAAEAGLITPILVGPEATIRTVAAEAGLDIGAFRIEPAQDSQESAARGVALVRAGEARLLMKGDLHTDELLHEVVRAAIGLGTGRRLSHVYVLDVPDYTRLLLVTDAVINIEPSLDEKRHIVQNAIDLARKIHHGVAKLRPSDDCSTGSCAGIGRHRLVF